jgi:hypothetical protein
LDVRQGELIAVFDEERDPIVAVAPANSTALPGCGGSVARDWMAPVALLLSTEAGAMRERIALR